MAEAAIQSDQPPDETSGENDEVEIVGYWLGEIERAQKTFKEYNDRCDKIAKRFRDERDAAKRGVRKFNILWSNIQTMKPAVYAKPPKPVIERRFLERNDVERTAGMILERSAMVEMETGNFDESIGGRQGAVMDYLLYGRGQVWLRYEAEIDEKDESSVEDDEDELDEEVEQAETSLPVVTSEHLDIDFVHRSDFLHDPARTWKEVRWVAKRSWMTKRDVRGKGWQKGIEDRLEYKDMNAENRDRDGQDRRPVERRAELWEIWDKSRRVVWVISPSVVDLVIHKEDDPLGLKDFWPCPKPLYATLTADTLVPVPDYAEYQDQADELDELSERIARLTQAIKACGVYDASQPEIGQIFQTTTDNKLIASENWGAFKERGGFNGSMELLNIEMMAKTLAILDEQFQNKLSRLYEITGIADIIRGNSDPDETYGAQKLKGQFATLRLKDRQKDVANFCRDVLRIMVELISLHFSPQTLAVMTGMADTNLLQQGLQAPPGMPVPQAQPGTPQQPIPPQLTNDQSQQLQQIPLFQQALKLIKDSRLRTFRIDIENMSTIEMDIEQDKASATELLKGIGEFCTGVLPVGQKVPQLMPLFGEMILHAVRKFRSGRELESTLEQTVDQLEGLAKQAAANPPPDPEMAKVQQQANESQQKMAMEQSSQQNDQRMEQSRFQFEQLQHRDDLQLQREKFQQEMALEREKHGNEMVMRQRELEHSTALENQKQQHDLNAKAADREHNTALKDKELTQNAKFKQQELDQSKEIEGNKVESAERMAGMKADPSGAHRQRAHKETEDKMTPLVQELIKSNQQLAKALTAPKRLVRGKDGRASHVETMMQ